MTRIFLYATLGTLCGALGYAWDSLEFFCFIVLFICADYLGRLQGAEEQLQHDQAVLTRAKALLEEAQQLHNKDTQ
jgi:hypothetical protein